MYLSSLVGLVGGLLLVTGAALAAEGGGDLVSVALDPSDLSYPLAAVVSGWLLGKWRPTIVIRCERQVEDRP